MPTPTPSAARVATILAGIVFLACMLVLAGWQLNVMLFKSVIPGLMAMNPLTALAFLVMSSVLLLLVWNGARMRALIFVGVVIVTVSGLQTVIRYLFGVDFTIDQLLFAEKLDGNRMPPIVGFNLLLCGMALGLTLSDSFLARRISQWMALAVVFVAMLAVNGYVFDALALARTTTFIPMAVHTSACLLFVSVALLCVHSREGVVGILQDAGAVGSFSRLLLPAALAIPFALGYLRLIGEQLGLYDTTFGVALSVTLTMVLMAGFVWWSARHLAALNVDRRRAESEIEKSHHFLDSIIENIPNMIFVKDAKDLRFVKFNLAGEQLIGVPRANMIGKNDHDFFPLEQAAFFMQKDREVLSGKKLVDIPEEPLQTKTNGTRILHTKKIPILDGDGTPLYLLGISEDITERKAREEELQRRTEEVERMCRTMHVDPSSGKSDTTSRSK